MDWWLFATKLEMADTSEVTVLNNYAPPLYSAVSAVAFWQEVPVLELAYTSPLSVS